MKRVFKNPVVTFILGAIIFSSISVYAAHKYYASDITYKDTTLDQALDTLYTKAKTYKNLTETTNVESNTLLSGKKAYKSDGSLVNGSIQTYSDAINVTPSNAQQVLQTAGKYVSSNITVGSVPSSYKDTSLATITSASDILAGKKGYLKNGTLVDGTRSECVSSSFICSEKCLNSTGINLTNFSPTLFSFFSDDFFTFYSSVYNSQSFLYLNGNDEGFYNINDYYIKDNKLNAHNWGESFLGKNVYYVACK